MIEDAERRFLDDAEDHMRLEAERGLMRREIDFLVRRGAFENYPDSYEGMRYRMEKTLKRPVSHQEDLELRRISRELLEANAALTELRKKESS